MKALGILILFAAVVLMSLQKSRSLKDRAVAIEQTGQFVKALGRKARFTSEQTGALIRLCSDPYDRLSFLRDWADGVNAGDSPDRALAAVLREDILGRDGAALLTAFASSLGRYDGVTLERISFEYADRFQQLAAQADLEYRDKGKLYRGLGLYIGAALAVIFI